VARAPARGRFSLQPDAVLKQAMQDRQRKGRVLPVPVWAMRQRTAGEARKCLSLDGVGVRLIFVLSAREMDRQGRNP